MMAELLFNQVCLKLQAGWPNMRTLPSGYSHNRF